MALKRIQPALAYAASHLDEDVSLATLARQSGLSVFHLQRAFSTTAGETPKQFTLRLRLGRAAAMLLTRTIPYLISRSNADSRATKFSAARFEGVSVYRPASIANAASSMPPQSRSLRITQPSSTRSAHASGSITPMNKKECCAIHHHQTRNIPDARIDHEAPCEAIRDCADYRENTPRDFPLFTEKWNRPRRPSLREIPGIEHRIRDHRVRHANRDREPGYISDPAVIHDTLPGGPVAFTTHHGPYDNLPEAHAALEAWIEAGGLTQRERPGNPTSPTQAIIPIEGLENRTVLAGHGQACAINPIRRFEGSGGGSRSL